MNADPDGVGAIFGLFFLFKQYYPNKKVFFNLNSISQFSLRLIALSQLENVLKEQLINEEILDSVTSKDLSFDLIICDTHNLGNIQQIGEKLQSNIERIFWIDHHLETEYSSIIPKENHRFSSKTELKFICNDFKASSEMILQIFYLLESKLDHNFLKILLLGILTDSRRLRLADSNLLNIITYWLNQSEKISLSSLFELLDNDYSRSEKIARLKGAQRIIVRNISDYLVVFTNISSFEASTANALIQIGADISCAIAETKNEIRISLRGRTNNLEKLSIHLGELAGKIASKFGGTGSGHLGAAGINIPGSFTWLEIRKKVELLITEEIEEKIINHLNINDETKEV
jgi:nanoRNase/pAp phosphatase (c-di-AMP/oligoRNAs hydrolase)